MTAPVTVCALCAFKALLDGQPRPEPFAETPEEHLARVHPDPVATQRESDEIARRIDERKAMARTARFN